MIPSWEQFQQELQAMQSRVQEMRLGLANKISQAGIPLTPNLHQFIRSVYAPVPQQTAPQAGFSRLGGVTPQRMGEAQPTESPGGMVGGFFGSQNGTENRTDMGKPGRRFLEGKPEEAQQAGPPGSTTEQPYFNSGPSQPLQPPIGQAPATPQPIDPRMEEPGKPKIPGGRQILSRFSRGI